MTDVKHTSDRVRIIHGPRIETGAGDGPEAIAVCAGRIVGLGDVTTLRTVFPAPELTKIDGALLVPGFNDAHIHPFFAAEPELRVDLRPETVGSHQEAVRLLAEKARATPEGDWIVGAGYDVLHAPEGRLDRTTLDAITNRHPVYIAGSTWHAAIANSPALALIRAHGDGGESGGTFGRDDSGELDGWLYELPHMKVAWSGTDEPELLPQLPATALVDALARQNRYLNSCGITSYTDALVTPQMWRAYDELRARGQQTARTSMALWHTYRDLLDHLPITTGFGDEWLRFAGVKLMYDGAISGGTCLCSEPYESPAGSQNGLTIMSTGELQAIVSDLHHRGVRACVHANGDAAISDVMDAIELAQRQAPHIDIAHRIEHCSITDDMLLKRIAAAGVIPVPFAAFTYYYGDQIVHMYSAERAARLARHRSMLDAGITVAGSSDWPCGPAGVLRGLHTLTSRTTERGLTVGPYERLSLRDALWVYTAGSAAATGEAGLKGRIAVGQLADFTILSEDIFAKRDWFEDTQVVSTWVAGEMVWASTTH